MRMWMVNPRKMCRKHLLGEHLETHMFATAIRKNYSLNGYIQNNLLELKSVKLRHDDLVKEMKRRGYNHRSPMSRIVLGSRTKNFKIVRIDSKKSLRDLLKRCQSCFINFKKS